MNVLLDTHALIWLLDASPRLSEAARRAAERADIVYVSAASAWEIATKVRIGKLDFLSGSEEEIEAVIRRRGAVPLPITFAHATMAGKLAIKHQDPFDRMLIAQALLDSLTLVSNERRFDDFGVLRIW